MCVRTHRLRPDVPGTQDALDAPWQRTYRSQRKTHRQCEFGRSSPRHLLTGRSVAGHFRSRRTVSGHFPSGHTVSGHFPSGRSHVRAFSFWTQPCQGSFLLDVAVLGQMASGRCVSWHRGYAGCEGTENRSKYSRRIHKHIVGSRHSDSVQFYSLYLMHIYICYYHTSRFQHKHPASHPSPQFLTRIVSL